jgi:hypothetical protein
MKTNQQIEAYINAIYAYERLLTDNDRASLSEIEYRPALGELLYLLAVSEIELSTYRLCRRKGDKVDRQIHEYYACSVDEKHIPNGEQAFIACMNLAMDENLADISFDISVKIANSSLAKFTDGYFIFDETAIKLARVFGLHFCLLEGSRVLPIDDEQLDELENVDKLIPQNAEQLYYVNLLRDKTAFMSLFAANYASGEKVVTANLPAEYDAFVRQMNAAYTVSVYARFRTVFASAGLLKLYDFQAVDGLQKKGIRLSQPTDDESADRAAHQKNVVVKR